METLEGFYYHNQTGFIVKRIGKTKFSHTYKLVNVRCVLGIYDGLLSQLNLNCHDNDVTPAEDVQFLKDLEITRQEINDEFIYRYGFDYSDRMF